MSFFESINDFLSLSVPKENPYTDYNQKYLQYSKKIGSEIAVSIIAYNRPDYFVKLLSSIEKNEKANSWPFFFFLDGGKNSTQDKLIQLIEESKIKQKIIIRRKINYGCPINHVDSKRFLFDFCKFDKVITLEDDLILSKNYFRLLIELDKWANKKYSNIGCVQLDSNCQLSIQEKQKKLHLVQETTPRWRMLGYLMRKSVWNEIKGYLYKYETFIVPFLNQEHYQTILSKPSDGPTKLAFQTWILSLTKKYSRENTLSKFEKNIYSSSYLLKNWDGGSSSMNHDEMFSFFLFFTGYTRVQTVVNRLDHIGEEGISGLWYNCGCLDEFSDDSTLTNFEKSKGKQKLINKLSY